VKNNVMLVGDCSHQVNPTTGGGIISGMIGGYDSRARWLRSYKKGTTFHTYLNMRSAGKATGLAA